MIGSILNALTIVVGGALGLLVGKRLGRSMTETLIWVLGIVTVIFGVQMVIETQNVLIVLVSLVLGAVVGEALKIEAFMEQFAKKIEMKIEGKKSGAQFA